MDIAHIRKLIRLMEGTDVTEIEVTEGEQTIRVSRQHNGAGHPAGIMHYNAPVMQATPNYSMPAEAAPTVAAESKPSHNDAHVVKAPMVGTFYAAASPDSDPFASVGKRVKKGETLCIIEAMKLMNQIEAEYDGIVEEILVNNASAIEYGQPLFIVVPA
ncbi:MAG: acetyl-CoA carboxylase biotin carboxyl carrier protein [Zetaproteobacteria bacterium]|nr:acetyl-CoA carboxylase biotin carboxyl carrier protein [Zetaproteobacteria bacterium]